MVTSRLKEKSTLSIRGWPSLGTNLKSSNGEKVSKMVGFGRVFALS